MENSNDEKLAQAWLLQEMCSFYKYYAGEAIAPMLTIFIGGNHEASNYLQVKPFRFTSLWF
jgi:hypothetical protein